MTPRLTSSSHHPWRQRVGKSLGHRGKHLFGGVLRVLLPLAPNLAIGAVRDVHRVLIVRPNFRIGNTLMATPLIIALRERFPGAQLDFLCGDSSAALLAHLPVDTVHIVSRQFLLQPWRFAILFIRLRRVHYDVAIEAGMGSFSGGLYGYLTGARYRLGCTGKADRFLNVRLPEIHTSHAYDTPVEFARLLGVSCPSHPVYTISPEERAAAQTVLTRLNLAAEESALPFVALLVGGHLDKRWPVDRWIEVAQALAGAGGRVVVFLGPEEMPFASQYHRELAPSVRILQPQPLRIFAALLSAAHVIVTPDSGSMHLAAALGVPAIVVGQSDRSRVYTPRGEQDRVLMRPTGKEVIAAILTHPSWRRFER